jgi:capsular polysaccharide biosynthesis protein/Mrp family chromosome partitioning ATPase
MNSVSRPDSLDMADYTGLLRRRWPIVLAAVVICLVGALGYIVTAPKAYTSTANVYVSPTGASQSNQLANSRTSSGTVNLDTEAQIVTSGTVATMAGKTLHSSLTPYRLAKEISVTVPPNSQNMLIACTASSKTGAAACANAFAAAYLQNRSSTASSSIHQQISSLQKQISSLQKQVASLTGTISSLPSNSPQRNSAQSSLTSDQHQLSGLNDKLTTLYSQALQTNGGNIITKAQPPGSPSSPKKTLILPSGIVAGLIIGLIAAFLWDRRDKRIHTARDAERFFGLPVLMDLSKQSVGRQVSLASPRSRMGRAFTALAQTMASSLGEGSHVVLVAGTTPGPGVSVIAANLAAALARTHSEAVLVCAALRDSVAPAILGISDGRGLAEVVAGRATVGEVAAGPPAAPGLWVIPPGADISLAEYNLQHSTVRALISQLRRDAGFVIIEVQANEDGADTFALAEFADVALLTVETRRTTSTDGEASIRRLQQMRTQIIGTVVLPPVRERVSVRPPQAAKQPTGSVPGGRRPAEGKAGRDGASIERDQIPSFPGISADAEQDRKLLRPARSAERFPDRTGRISGS